MERRGAARKDIGRDSWGGGGGSSGSMAVLIALCSGLRRTRWKLFVKAAARLAAPATHQVLRSCSQYQQVTDTTDLPISMENPYKEPLKKCILCGKRVDYKNVQLLSQFISPFTGCIYGRHITGLCGKKQKEITKAIKRAKIMGFMPVTYKDPAYLKDPKVCNIKYRE